MTSTEVFWKTRWPGWSAHSVAWIPRGVFFLGETIFFPVVELCVFFLVGGVLITKTRNFWEGKDPSFRRLTTTVTCKITSNDVMRFLLEVFCSPEFCWYKSRNKGGWFREQFSPISRNGGGRRAVVRMEGRDERSSGGNKNPLNKREQRSPFPKFLSTS